MSSFKIFLLLIIDVKIKLIDVILSDGADAVHSAQLTVDGKLIQGVGCGMYRVSPK